MPSKIWKRFAHSSTQREEQVRVLSRARDHACTLGGEDIELESVVGHSSKQCAERSNSSSLNKSSSRANGLYKKLN